MIYTIFSGTLSLTEIPKFYANFINIQCEDFAVDTLLFCSVFPWIKHQRLTDCLMPLQPGYTEIPRSCFIQQTAMVSSVVREELTMRKSLF